MDIAGLVCLMWGFLFTVACMQFNFTTWHEWDITQQVTEETWNNTPKGLVFVPLIIALFWSAEAGNVSSHNILSIFWERAALMVLGIVAGSFLSRALR